MIHIDFNSIVCSIIAVLITTPITMWLTSMSPLKIRLFFIRLIHPFAWLRRCKPQINGIWDGVWVKGDNFDSPIDGRQGIQRIRIYQFGNIIVGKSVMDDSDYIVAGEIKKYDVFNGTYYDPRDNTEYYGTFQVIYRDENKMEGKWVGFNNDTKSDINTGVWIWTKKQSSSV